MLGMEHMTANTGNWRDLFFTVDIVARFGIDMEFRPWNVGEMLNPVQGGQQDAMLWSRQGWRHLWTTRARQWGLCMSQGMPMRHHMHLL